MRLRDAADARPRPLGDHDRTAGPPTARAMTDISHTHHHSPPTTGHGLRRVVVGVNGSPESLAAMRQAAALTAPGAELLLVDAVEPVIADVRGWVPVAVNLESEPALRSAALQVLEDASRRAGPERTVRARVVSGPAGDVLAVEAAEADLVAVGLRGHSRADGIVNRRAASVLLHEAPCPVLIARPGRPDVPESIVAAVDGSPRSLAALDLAGSLAGLTNARLTALVATRGQHLDLDAIREAVGRRGLPLQMEAESPVQALDAVDADLIVMGSRGVRGVRALGSVSEAVGHAARASVLVVRANPAADDG
jgi:nucleotide-binding universal stress UspA family protein